MKSILAMATLALVALVLEDKARQLAGDAQNAYGGVVVQARESSEALGKKVENQPIVAVLIAAAIGFAFSRDCPGGELCCAPTIAVAPASSLSVIFPPRPRTLRKSAVEKPKRDGSDREQLCSRFGNI